MTTRGGKGGAVRRSQTHRVSSSPRVLPERGETVVPLGHIRHWVTAPWSAIPRERETLISTQSELPNPQSLPTAACVPLHVSVAAQLTSCFIVSYAHGARYHWCGRVARAEIFGYGTAEVGTRATGHTQKSSFEVCHGGSRATRPPESGCSGIWQALQRLLSSQ